MKLAVSGASGKTGFRIAEEAIKKRYEVSLLTRESSEVPDSLRLCKRKNISLFNKSSLDKALEGIDILVIATGARPSIDLTGPAKIDAYGVNMQVESCKRMGVKKIVLVSSLCIGKIFHPLNLFGLILLFKKIGEDKVINSGLDWTIIRPGGLNEKEEGINKLNVLYSKKNKQEEGSIPRRLVAKCCIEALNTDLASRKIVEITSNEENKKTTLKDALKTID